MLSWIKAKLKWIVHVHHTATTVECLREQKFKEIDEKINNAQQAIDEIYARMNGDADWFMHVSRKREEPLQ